MLPGTLNLTCIREIGMEPVEIRCKDGDGNAVPLAGWSAFAQVRKMQGAPVILDLVPAIAGDDEDGLITLPRIQEAVSIDLPLGRHVWDLILQDPEGIRIPPILTGSFTINSTVTIP